MNHPNDLEMAVLVREMEQSELHPHSDPYFATETLRFGTYIRHWLIGHKEDIFATGYCDFRPNFSIRSMWDGDVISIRAYYLGLNEPLLYLDEQVVTTVKWPTLDALRAIGR